MEVVEASYSYQMIQMAHEIKLRYEMGLKLGWGGFRITYLCRDKENGNIFACKLISKMKLRTTVDINNVMRAVEIMKHMPKHRNIVSLKDTFKDDNSINFVMEFL